MIQNILYRYHLIPKKSELKDYSRERFRRLSVQVTGLKTSLDVVLNENEIGQRNGNKHTSFFTCVETNELEVPFSRLRTSSPLMSR